VTDANTVNATVAAICLAGLKPSLVDAAEDRTLRLSSRKTCRTISSLRRDTRPGADLGASIENSGDATFSRNPPLRVIGPGTETSCSMRKLGTKIAWHG